MLFVFKKFYRKNRSRTLRFFYFIRKSLLTFLNPSPSVNTHKSYFIRKSMIGLFGSFKVIAIFDLLMSLPSTMDLNLYKSNMNPVVCSALRDFIFYVMKNTNTHARDKGDSYWKNRCELAEKYISESPCDPDIYPEQFKAYQAWRQCLDKQNEENEIIESNKKSKSQSVDDYVEGFEGRYSNFEKNSIIVDFCAGWDACCEAKPMDEQVEHKRQFVIGYALATEQWSAHSGTNRTKFWPQIFAADGISIEEMESAGFYPGQGINSLK